MRRRFRRALLATLLLGVGCAGAPAHATCSTEPYIGSLCVTAYNFCPRNYADAAGQTLAIAQNTALFSLLGTTYGGNGTTTFALPDLRARVPRGVGQGPGLANNALGQVSGQENVTLTSMQLPVHTHSMPLPASSSPADVEQPGGAVPAVSAQPAYATGAGTATLAGDALVVGAAGGGQPVNMINPYLGLRYCIALYGLYPQRP